LFRESSEASLRELGLLPTSELTRELPSATAEGRVTRVLKFT